MLNILKLATLTNQVKYIYLATFVVYVFLIIFNNTLYGINDDKYFKFLAQNNTWIGLDNFINNNNGRFFPIHGLFYYLVYKISPPDTIIINNVLFGLIFILCCSLIYKTIPKNTLQGFFFWLLLLVFSQPIVSIFFQLAHEEKFILFYFILFYFILLKRKENLLSSVLLFVIGNLIIYSKEPGIAFVLIIGFGLIYFQSISKNKNKFYFFTGGLLVISSLISIAIYIIIVYPRIIPEFIYGKNTDKYFIYFVVNLSKFIINEPVIFIIFFPYLTIKLFKIFITKSQKLSVHEIMCIGATGYVATFFITKTTHSDYYLSPIYGVVIPYLAQLFKKEENHTCLRKEKLITVMITFQILNIELGLSLIPFIRYNNKNLHSVIKYISIEEKANQLGFYSVNDRWRDNCTQHVIFAIQFYQNKKQNPGLILENNSNNNSLIKNERISQVTFFVIETPWNIISKENSYNLEKIIEFKTYKWEAKRNANFILSALVSRIKNESEKQQNNKQYVRTPNYSIFRLKPITEKED